MVAFVANTRSAGNKTYNFSLTNAKTFQQGDEESG